MASPRKGQWETMQDFVEKLVFDDAPKFVQQVVERGIEQGIRVGLDLLTGASAAPAAISAGRPVTSISAPTADRARQLVYAPDLAGRADPGEIVWTWVVHGNDPDRGEDRPVLVVGRDHGTLLGLMVCARQGRDARNWVGIGSGSWDESGAPSWVQLDRVLDVPEEGIRRQGAILDRAAFEAVAARLRVDYSWS